MRLRHIQYYRGSLRSLHLALLLSGSLSTALTPESRWAQATVVINDALFVHGGKTDPFNSYSYTSAPTSNELLYLPLSQPFDASNPPWQLVNSSTDPSTSQAPSLAWHTLSAFNTSGNLLFGGQPGPNSPPPVLDGADSAFLLDISNPLQADWLPQVSSWGNEPIRRIFHSSATSPTGIVYIIGGQQADGSGIGFPDHYAFDPQALAFSQLPTENAPPAIYGHVSIMFPDGRLFVFGGASQGTLIPLSTIWVLDTSTNALTWTQLQADNSTIPSPRRAFAAVAIGDGKILLQGGSDVSLQTNLDDGWILDTSQNPVVWAPVEQLSQIGARRDHFAVSSNGLVLFDFGYLNNGPAPAALLIFNPFNNSYGSSYTPPSPTAPITQTIPGETGMATYQPGRPITSGATSDPAGTVAPGDDSDQRTQNPAVPIAVGTTFGVLGAIVAGVVVVMYSRRQQKRRAGAFMVIADDEDAGNTSLHGSVIPIATMYSRNGATSTNRWGTGLLGAAFGIAGSISAVTKLRNARDSYQRRDMLADEDTRDFGEWYNARRRDGTGGSSWTLKSVLGARFRSREPSTYSYGSAGHRQDKTDPFLDSTSLIHDQEPATPGFETSERPHNRRETSYLSTSSYSYLDPFVDPAQDEKADIRDTDEHEPTSTANTISRSPPFLPPIRIVPPASLTGHPLSPLSEHTSLASLPSNDHTVSSSHGDSSQTPAETTTSHTTMYTAIDPSPTTKSSTEAHKSPSSPPSSIIPASVSPANVRRSDSWWSKFYRTSILDRGSGFRPSGIPEIRDPNPPPALDPIIESLPQPSEDNTFSESKVKSQFSAPSKSKVYVADPGNSMTSLRTADTERIERIAGVMDVAQRVRMRSERTTGSMSSGLSIDTRWTSHDDGVQDEFGARTSPLEIQDLSSTLVSRPPLPTSSASPLLPPKGQNSSQERSGPAIQLVPLDKTHVSQMVSPSTDSTSPASPSVAARVRMYERRLSQDKLPPTNTRQREERSAKKNRISVDYGFVPRPNLFVANPDHGNSRSSDS